MSRHPITTGSLLTQAFWEDPRAMKMTSSGAVDATQTGVPDHHLLFETSGSSGDPKWIAISKTALRISAAEVNRHLDVDAGSVWGLALPIHHVGGFGVIARAFDKNCTLQVYNHSWDPVAFTRWLEAGGITHTSMVPTQVHDVVHAGCGAPATLRVVVVGGGRLDPALAVAARDLGWPVLASYGLTEAASQVATHSLSTVESADFPLALPVLPHWQVRSDPEGCLEIAGPALFSGTVSGGAYQPRQGEWLATRDRVDFVPGGLVPRGRADVLVKIAGELVDPLVAESRIAALLGPDGGGVAVVPVEDERLGHQFMLVAEARVPAAALVRAIESYNATVPRSQRMSAPVVVPELPRSPIGKIQRRTLRDILREIPRP